MKILYNPILGGEYIQELKLNVDKYIQVDQNKYNSLTNKYPFLIDISKDIYQPSYIDKRKKPSIINQPIKTKKNIWDTIKIKFRKLSFSKTR